MRVQNISCNTNYRPNTNNTSGSVQFGRRNYFKGPLETTVKAPVVQEAPKERIIKEIPEDFETIKASIARSSLFSARMAKEESEALFRKLSNEEFNLERNAQDAFGKHFSFIKNIAGNIANNTAITVSNSELHQEFEILCTDNKVTAHALKDNISLIYIKNPEPVIEISDGYNKLIYTYNSDGTINSKIFYEECGNDDACSFDVSLKTYINKNGNNYHIIKVKVLKNNKKQSTISDKVIEFFNSNLVNYSEKAKNGYEASYNYNRNNGELVFGYQTNPERNIENSYLKGINKTICSDGSLKYMYEISKPIKTLRKR